MHTKYNEGHLNDSTTSHGQVDRARRQREGAVDDLDRVGAVVGRLGQNRDGAQVGAAQPAGGGEPGPESDEEAG